MDSSVKTTPSLQGDRHSKDDCFTSQGEVTDDRCKRFCGENPQCFAENNRQIACVAKNGTGYFSLRLVEMS